MKYSFLIFLFCSCTLTAKEDEIIEASAFDEVISDSLINDRIHTEEIVVIDGINYTTTTAGRKEKVIDVHIVGLNKYTSIIKRPDYSITPTDNNFGIFLEPVNPTQTEVDAAQWQVYNGNNVGILMRGSIILENLTIDCNMGAQNIPVNKSQVEHSSMIGVAGRSYSVTRTGGQTGTLYIGFNSVEFRNIRILNRGSSDAIWIGRGYFRPHISDVVFENVQSFNNVNQARADIGFSGLVEAAYFYNCQLDKIEAESNDSWLNSPGLVEFAPAKFVYYDVRVKRLDFASKAKSLYMLADNVRTTEWGYLYQVGGIIKNSTFIIEAGDLERMNRMDSPVFENCTFYIKAHSTNTVRGIRPEGFTYNGVAENCTITFNNCRFIATGSFASGRLIYTEKTTTPQIVNLTFNNCYFDQRFGVMTGTKIALLREKGTVIFNGGNVSLSKIDNGGQSATTLIVNP